MSVSVCLSHQTGPRTAWTEDFWSNSVLLNCKTKKLFIFFGKYDQFLCLKYFCVFRVKGLAPRNLFLYWQTILLCIVVKVAREGSVVVAVGIGDIWHMKYDTWQVTIDIFGFGDIIRTHQKIQYLPNEAFYWAVSYQDNTLFHGK